MNSGKDRQTILIVDDSAMNRCLLSDMLSDYEVIEAENGEQAVLALQEHGMSISLMLLDIVMPEMDGFGVLEVMTRQGWIDNIPVIMVSSETNSASVERALSFGVTDFISRPFDTSIVRRRVVNTLTLYAKQQELSNMVEEQVRERENSVNQMIAILSHIVEFRNGESGQHVQNVNMITDTLIRRVNAATDKHGLSDKDMQLITMASSLHDIGKISIPEEVLNKPGKLTDEEFELMKTHSAVGSEMLQDLDGYPDEPLIRYAYEICRWHHERYDGRGYPDGLKGDDIPISAQVVSIADVYDALTSKRVYKPPIPHDKAMEMIFNGECGAFDPFLLECFKDASDEIRERLKNPNIPSSISQHENASGETVSSSDIAPSSRTLDLLDYERVKYRFFAMMSNEVQFEFTSEPDVLVISDCGTKKLGFPEIIQDPMHDAKMIEVFGEDQLIEFKEAIRSTDMDDPIVQFDFQANVAGESRWFHLAARAMWVESDNGVDYRGCIGKLIDIQESRLMLDELESKASRDSLTGIYNHAYAANMIESELQAHPDDTFVLMVLDMDHFKHINDTYGHLVGDEVLKEMARRLTDSVRENDVVSRVGGDEFMICMRMKADPKPLIGRVYESLLGSYDGHDLSLSMGVVCERGEGQDLNDLFNRADYALYEVKHAGGGGYKLSDVKSVPEGSFASTISKIDSAE